MRETQFLESFKHFARTLDVVFSSFVRYNNVYGTGKKQEQICAQADLMICVQRAILGQNAYFQLPILLAYNFRGISIFCW